MHAVSTITYNMMTSSNGNIFLVTGHLCGESTQRPVTRSYDVFSYLRLNKRLNKQSWGWWFETLSRPLWRHRNDRRTINTVFVDGKLNFMIALRKITTEKDLIFVWKH